MTDFTDDDEEQALARPGGGRASATRPAPTPATTSDLPGPVDFRGLSSSKARELLEMPSGLAEALLPGFDEYELRQMAGSAIDITLSGAARTGLSRQHFVTRAAVGQGRFKNRLGQTWEDACALAVHGLFVFARQPVHHQEIR